MTVDSAVTEAPGLQVAFTRAGGAIEVLTRVAQAVSSTASLNDALGFVVHTTRELLQADRASILLLDPSGLLVPAVSAASQEDLALHRRFRTMAPITATLTPEGRALLEGGRAISIVRASDSPMVPAEWQQAFGLESLALAPIVSAGQPCGVLVVDARGEQGFSAEQLVMLEGVAASASIAVRDARAYAETVVRSGRLDRALAVAQELGRASDTEYVAQTALKGLCEVLDGDVGSLHLLSRDHTAFTTLSLRGLAGPALERHLFDDDTWQETAAVRELWRRDPTEPVVFAPGRATPAVGVFELLPTTSTTVVVPLACDGRVRAFAVVSRPAQDPPRPEELQLAASVAAQAWLALERARLTSALLGQARVARALEELRVAFPVLPDVAVLVERMAPVIRSVTGGELLDVRVVGRSAARHLRARVPSGVLGTVVRQWQREAEPRPVVSQGLVAVPMIRGRDLVGVLLVRGAGVDLTEGDASRFLLLAAAGAGEVLVEAALRRGLDDAVRDLALAGERERIADELQGEVGRTLSAVADLLRRACQHPDELGRFRDEIATSFTMLTGVRRELRETSRGLSTLRTSRRGLAPSLRELGKLLSATTGTSVAVRFAGEARPLPATHESVLLRVAHEAVVHLEGQSRASVVCLRVLFRAQSVELTVRDNGVAVGQRAAAVGFHGGMRAMKQRVADLGGQLTLASSDDPGLCLLVVLPTGG